MLATSDPDRIDIAFDDDRLVADAGLLLPATLAQHLGLQELADSCVDLGDAPGRANAGDKLLTLVASALAGGECIDDAAALRAGGTASVLGCTVKAPSTLGVFLRSFSWGHVRQLDRVSRKLLARAWAAGAGPGDAPLTIDLDSTLCETYGLAKEGARQPGYTGARGYHPLLAVAAGSGEVLMARLREGRANTARGAAHFLRETVGRVRAAGASGQLTVRADSGFYNHAVVAVCRKQDLRFSITIRQQPSVRRLIEAIPQEDWTPIPYWLPGGADVAETTYTPFQHTGEATPVRLIVRRVKPAPGSQLALFVNYSYHAFISDREGELLELEADHRRHAEIENAIRDLKYGVGLNHLPSGRFAANAAWLAVQVIAHNLARWTARLGLGEGIVTTRTLRRRYFALAGRLTHSPGAGPCTSRSAGPGLVSGQPPWRGYGRFRSRPDARSQPARLRARASMPAHASRTLAPARSAPPSRAERRLLAPARPRHRPASAATPAELSASPAARPVKLRSFAVEMSVTRHPPHRSVRARERIRLLPRVRDGKSLGGPRVEDGDARPLSPAQRIESLPREAVTLSTAYGEHAARAASRRVRTGVTPGSWSVLRSSQATHVAPAQAMSPSSPAARAYASARRLSPP